MIEKIEKPWGYELLFAKTKNYVGKVLVVRKGEELSLQYHKLKEETMYLAKGKLKIKVGDKDQILESGQMIHIPPGTHHWMKALEDSEIFEVSTPHLEDIVRLKDRYGRT